MTKIFRNFTRRFKNLNFKTKLLISYTVLIFIPLILVTLIAYFRIAQHMEDQIIYSTSQAFEQANSFLTHKLNTIINASDVIYHDTRVQDILTFGRGEYRDNVGLINRDMNNLISTLFSVMQANEDIFHLRLYVRDDFLFSEGNFYFLQFESAKQQMFYERLLERREKVIWTAPEQLELPYQAPKQVVSMIRGIRDSEQINEFIALMRIDISENTLKEIINKANMTAGSYTYIINNDDELICNAYESEKDKFQIDKSILDSLISNGVNWSTLSISGQKYIVGYQTVTNTDWTLVSVVPYRYIQSAGISIRNQVILVAILVGIAAYITAWFVTVSATKRIRNLAASMRTVQDGDFNGVVLSGINDEIGELEGNFNYMVERLSATISERVKSGQEKKTAELKALQAQINPHFLYNTLDLINWMALRNGIQSISGLVQSLAMFYKLSLSKGKDIVSIRDEIAHVTTYLEIQDIRFDNKIHFSFFVDESILDYMVPKIILQPLVENSIIHGILEKPEKTGTIRITGKWEGKNIVLAVEDDGVGFPAKMIETVPEKSNDGYGLINIDQRIKLYYGNQYGLTYNSTKEKGTISSRTESSRTVSSGTSGSITTVAILLPANIDGIIEKDNDN